MGCLAACLTRVAVTAILVSGRWHQAGAEALLRVGGRLEPVGVGNYGELIDAADLVLDGILGIGGAGALRDPATDLAARAAAAAAYVVAVDLPSGVMPTRVRSPTQPQLSQRRRQ